MTYKFNVFTGNFDLVDEADFNLILTGPTECLYAGPVAPLDVLIDENGNVLTGV